MKLGALLKAYRTANALTLRQLAREMGIHHSSLFRFERAGRGMRGSDLAKVLLWVLR